jgi:hypothetical protein
MLVFGSGLKLSESMNGIFNSQTLGDAEAWVIVSTPECLVLNQNACLIKTHKPPDLITNVVKLCSSSISGAVEAWR